MLAKQKITHQFIWKNNQKIIRALVKIAFINSIVFIVSTFHIPVPIHGIEVEKIDISKVIYFLLFGIVDLKILLCSVTMLPILDNLFHGHNFVTIPIEIIFNNLILIITFAHWKLMNQNSKWKSVLISLVTIIILTSVKLTYDLIVLILFTDLWTKITIFPKTILIYIVIFGLINTIKYGLMLTIMFYLKKHRKFLN